ncbi:TPA: DUF2591 domain-containing protein [Klebsiella pneumoniae]|uniref:DUF2591 domain-containing protein n=1 Tax=Klebsiella pneumoniae TaxID=573 RepID=UPI000E2D745B|nr:DUF2591 domain-containing protein [Klebsiella pneumoniae]SYH02595.1 Protein of uncharacterised function (DUF2591) [Klebsiella pneumoniae]SYH21116.1 Protein of uncharacterised function (DUF2591) [Klebsiella pneumoniae]VVJ50002.1 Protein of uncharacterised function (DUF2591) [Klebsiella pneumoniae]VVJ50630.1 Protein of uncharacterised function (DUF2591) [Klebsiella pneumoniae]
MMDYSKLSDFEINLRVAEIVVDYDCISRLPYTDMAVHWGDGANWHVFNPCNYPADAWPIITSNRIGIVPSTATDKWAAHHGDWDIAIADVNPLRAAMIIFLMMQDIRK